MKKGCTQPISIPASISTFVSYVEMYCIELEDTTLSSEVEVHIKCVAALKTQSTVLVNELALHL